MKHPSIEITIPVYNEEKRLTNGVRKLHAFCSENLETFHITIADNGSTDQTVELSNLLCSELGHLSLVQVDRKGVGRALKASWAKSNAEIIGYVDVDLSARSNSHPRGSQIIRGFKILLRSTALDF